MHISTSRHSRSNAPISTLDSAGGMVTVDGDAGEFVELEGPSDDVLGICLRQTADGPALELHVPRWAAEGQGQAVEEVLAREAHRALGPAFELPSDELGGPRLAVHLHRKDDADDGSGRLQVTATATATDRSREAEMLAQAEVVAGMGSWEFARETGAMRWSENFFRVYGLEPGEVPASAEEILARTHPDDRTLVQAEFDAMLSGLELQTMSHRIVLPDGDLRHVRVVLGVVEEGPDGVPLRFVGSVQDLTEIRRAEQEIQAHVAVAEALAAWPGLEPGAERLLEKLAGALECAGGVLWTPEDSHLVARVLWCDPTEDIGRYMEATRNARLAPGAGPPGLAWVGREPVLLKDAEFRAGGTDRARAARADDLGGAVAIPALDGADVVAVIELPFHADGYLTDRLLRSLAGIGHEIGQFLGRRRGQLVAARLSARELEVLQLSARGFTTAAAAEVLVVSPATVKTHLAHIYTKLGAPDRASAVAIALRLGLIA